MIKRLRIKGKVLRNSKEPKRVRFQGYSGDSVNLKDLGFDHPVVYDLETMEILNQQLPMNYNHNAKVGETNRIENNLANVFGTGEVTETNESAEKILNGTASEASLGLDAKKIVVSFHPKGMKANGRTFDGPHYLIKNTILDEVTFTEAGRDKWTGVRILNSELQKIKEKSMPKKVKNRQPDPRPTPKHQPTPKPDRIHNSVPIGKVLLLNSKYPEYTEMIAEKLDTGWSYQRIENAVRLAHAEDHLPTPPRIDNEDGKDTLEARLLHALCKDPDVTLEKHYGKEVRDRICNMQPIGLHETMVLSARRLGQNFSGHSDVEAMIDFLGKVNLGRIHNTAFSTFSMPNLFERVTQFVVEESWKIEGFFAPGMCYEKSHDDFKPTESFRPSGGQMWEGLQPDGRIKHGYFGKETRYMAELDTKAQMVMFDRQTMINGDMSKIRELIVLMMEGADMVPDFKLARRMLQQNGTFFVAGVNHFDYSLTEDNLFLALESVEQQTIEKGQVDWLNRITEGWWLIVPTLRMERAAWEILAQSEIVSNTTANTKQGKKNWFFDRFQVKQFRQLANTTFSDDASNNCWFLWPKGQTYAPFTISYLKNRKRPIVKTVDAPVDMLGFGMVGVFDININDREKSLIVRCDPDTNFTS